MDRASRMFCYISGVSFFGELIGLLSVRLFHTNTVVYNLIGISNLVMICIYFNYAVPFFRQYAVGFILGAASILVWLFSLLFMKGDNSASMIFEAALTIAMAAISIDQLLVRKSKSWIRLRNVPHFWFAWSLLAYWCITICHWLMRSYFSGLTETHFWYNSLLLVITMLLNIGVFMVFYRYPKMLQHNAI